MSVDPEALDDDLDTSVAEVIAAMRAHRAWLTRWHRHAICRIVPDEDVVTARAHETCRFGRWFARFSVPDAITPRVLQTVGQLHTELHARAREISILIVEGGEIQPAAYEELGRVAERFAREVLNIERTLRSRLAERDPLTGTSTRGAMMVRLERELELVIETGTDACLAMVDVDHFKQVNDTMGHRAGDDVLRAVAQCLRDVLRPRDSIFRYGGDEFLICLTELTLEAAHPVLERLRRQIADLRLGDPPVTLSIGIAALDADATLEACMDRADRALYAAKQGGRNRVASGAS